MDRQQLVKYSRQINLADIDIEGQQRLLQSRVMIVGLGGLGCVAAQYLTAAGIGHLTLIDGDSVDRSNLQRQILHYEQDIGRAKVDSAKDKLTRQNSDVSISTYAHFADEIYLNKNIPRHEVILDCSDNYATRCLINKLCFKYKTPLVSGAAIRMEGQLVSFEYEPEQACYECLATLFGEQQLSCVEAGVLSPVVGVIGSLQAVECLKQLLNIGNRSKYEEKHQIELMLYDAMNNEFKTFSINKNPACKICS